MNKGYQYYQPNEKDKKGKYGDCVIRAFSKALGKSWLEVFDEVSGLARELQCLPDDDVCVKEYLKRQGYSWNGLYIPSGSSRPTVKSFTREKDGASGVYIVKVAHHIVCVDGGSYFDTWDCGSYSVYGYWYKSR